MANNCWNWVSMTGDKDTLELLKNRMKDYDNFDNLVDWTNHIIQEDRFDREKESPYDVVGTRWWDVLWEEAEIQDGYMSIQGDSAWSPPTQLMELLAKEFKLEITIEFEEPGCDFGGYCTYDSNGLKEDHTVSYRQWSYEQDRYHYLEQFKEDIDHYETMEDVLNEHEFASKKDLLELAKIFGENELKQMK